MEGIPVWGVVCGVMLLLVLGQDTLASRCMVHGQDSMHSMA
jgi:hypothetical protein